MKPPLREVIIASPFTLPFWIGLVLFFHHLVSRDWETTPPLMQVMLVAGLCIWGIVTLKLIPKVWLYHFQQWRQRLAGRDPELVKQSRRKSRRQFLKLLVLAAWGHSTWWVLEHRYADNPEYYLATLSVSVVITWVGGSALVSRLWIFCRPLVGKIATGKEQPFIVAWCLPLPKPTTGADCFLPEYCKLVLETRTQKPETRSQKSEEGSLVAH